MGLPVDFLCGVEVQFFPGFFQSSRSSPDIVNYVKMKTWVVFAFVAATICVQQALSFDDDSVKHHLYSKDEHKHDKDHHKHESERKEHHKSDRYKKKDHKRHSKHSKYDDYDDYDYGYGPHSYSGYGYGGGYGHHGKHGGYGYGGYGLQGYGGPYGGGLYGLGY